MEARGESYATKAAIDPMISKEYILELAGWYLNGVAPRTPLAAPLYTDLMGLPPLLIQVGSAETLFDDSVHLAARAGAADVRVTLEVWPHMQSMPGHCSNSNLPKDAEPLPGQEGSSGPPPARRPTCQDAEDLVFRNSNPKMRLLASCFSLVWHWGMAKMPAAGRRGPFAPHAEVLRRRWRC